MRLNILRCNINRIINRQAICVKMRRIEKFVCSLISRNIWLKRISFLFFQVDKSSVRLLKYHPLEYARPSEEIRGEGWDRDKARVRLPREYLQRTAEKHVHTRATFARTHVCKYVTRDKTRRVREIFALKVTRVSTIRSRHMWLKSIERNRCAPVNNNWQTRV